LHDGDLLSDLNTEDLLQLVKVIWRTNYMQQ